VGGSPFSLQSSSKRNYSGYTERRGKGDQRKSAAWKTAEDRVRKERLNWGGLDGNRRRLQGGGGRKDIACEPSAIPPFVSKKGEDVGRVVTPS